MVSSHRNKIVPNLCEQDRWQNQYLPKQPLIFLSNNIQVQWVFLGECEDKVVEETWSLMGGITWQKENRRREKNKNKWAGEIFLWKPGTYWIRCALFQHYKCYVLSRIHLATNSSQTILSEGLSFSLNYLK